MVHREVNSCAPSTQNAARVTSIGHHQLVSAQQCHTRCAATVWPWLCVHREKFQLRTNAYYSVHNPLYLMPSGKLTVSVRAEQMSSNHIFYSGNKEIQFHNFYTVSRHVTLSHFQQSVPVSWNCNIQAYHYFEGCLPEQSVMEIRRVILGSGGQPLIYKIYYLQSTRYRPWQVSGFLILIIPQLIMRSWFLLLLFSWGGVFLFFFLLQNVWSCLPKVMWLAW